MYINIDLRCNRLYNCLSFHCIQDVNCEKSSRMYYDAKKNANFAFIKNDINNYEFVLGDSCGK